ncbi:MAG TPA: ATP-dependent helicase HrpB [Steroidobacteraceae bacterium]
MTSTLSRLPIVSALASLQDALRDHASVVLQAPPGAGKSTGVPLALLEEGWLDDRKIVMLEPRRLAARAVAARMASMLGEPVGATVGYRTRLETKASAKTRIEVLTEGILTRWLQRDPALEGVGIVLFDEFHERSLNADLGLALCLDAQQTLREDLKLLVMSATLDTQPIAELLGGAPIVSAEGKAFDVETHWRERRPGSRAMTPEQDISRAIAATVQHTLEHERGDILVFLPGQGEIRRTQRLLEEAGLPREVRVFPLYGDLSSSEQDAAIRPSAPGQRKIVLATNIAETSLTIEGVRVVIDSGLARRSRFDPATGMSRLETVRISRASADQRRGRAGRTEAGVCYRLWSQTEHASLPAQTPPEIVEADLASLALELAEWGIQDPKALRWLDPPPAAAFAQARDLLQSLEALDRHGRITGHGRMLARLGTHPRLAHMIVRAAELGLRQPALELAAVLSERDLLRATPDRNVDVRLRLEALRTGRLDVRDDPLQEARVDQSARQRALRSMEILGRQLEQNDVAEIAHAPEADIGRLLAFAYPDRIAQARGSDGRYLLASGRGARLPEAQSLARSEFLVVADLDAGDREAMIRLAAPLSREDLDADFAAQIEDRERIEWDSREQAVAARRERWLGALKLAEQRIEQPDPERVASALLTGVRELGLAALPWTKEARALQARMIFARSIEPDAQPPWPDVSDPALERDLEQWLTPWIGGLTRRDHLSRLDMLGILSSKLDWSRRQRLDEIAPSHLQVPSGSRIAIDYSAPSPIVSVRLQELFGMRHTPTVGRGKVPLTLQLLSPAHRPVQVTQDLESFWARGYPEVKKELKGRYPKHFWPDDPLIATATARPKRSKPQA